MRLRFRDDWALVPGPIHVDGRINTSSVKEVADYSAKEIERHVLKFPGVRVTHDATPDYQRWAARIETHLGVLSLKMALHDDETFGGFFIYGNFDRQVLLDFWNHLRTNFPAIWLFTPADQHIYNMEAALAGPLA